MSEALPTLGRPARVLIIARSLDPDSGSEPGAGWGLMRAVSEFAECTVLTCHPKPAALPPIDGIRIVHVLDNRMEIAKRNRIAWFLSYLNWLRDAERVARRLHAETPFDVVHHATFSTYWLPSPATRIGPPSVWGPVGGAVTTPLSLWPLLGARGLLDEWIDRIAVWTMARLPATRRTWREATVVLAQNEETLRRLPSDVRARTRVLNHALFAEVAGASTGASTGEAREGIVWVGSLESRKCPRLAIEALAHADPDVHLTLLGDGPQRASLERLANGLGLRDRIEFRGAVPREDVLVALRGAAAAVFTGVREEGGLALAEAMSCGTPVIVLANGGAATIAAGTTDPDRATLIQPSGVRATAKRFGAAMTEHVRRTRTDATETIDFAAARAQLRDAFDAAIRAAAESTGR
jgi:glycosyltransferase involved in cell wall biosynthesis